MNFIIIRLENKEFRKVIDYFLFIKFIDDKSIYNYMIYFNNNCCLVFYKNNCISWN